MKQLKTPIEIFNEMIGREDFLDKLEVIEAIESYHSQFEDKWISVEDRLPLVDSYVLCYFSNGRTDVCKYTKVFK